MLNAIEAKSAFRKNLLLLLAIILWPIVAVIIYGIAYAVGFSAHVLLGFGMAGLWLVILILLILSLWKVAADIGVTPWAFLWILLPFSGPFLIGMLFLEPLKYKGDDLPASKQLPLTWGLIKETWAFTYKNYQTLIKTSVWILYTFLGFGISGALASVWLPFSILHFFVIWIVFGLILYFVIKLFIEAMTLEAGKKLNGLEGTAAKVYFGPTLWVAILAFFIPLIPMFILAIFGLMLTLSQISPLIKGTSQEVGTLLMLVSHNVVAAVIFGVLFVVLFVSAWIWAIYKFNTYGLAIPALLVDDFHSTAALKESERIIKNRWWGLFWKNQLWGIVLQGAMMLVVMAITIIMGIILVIFRNSGFQEPLTAFLSNAMNGVIYMLVSPLIAVFLVKLYKAFSKSASK
ncbi:hypothetical protein KKG46_01415 [Patescibacteria group bacterium]|nr:hypothetical protein [Patescibacteria group bacterium]